MNKQLLNIQIKSEEIIKQIEQLDILNSNYLYEYKILELKNICSIIKECPRCKKYFIPAYSNIVNQIYCDKKCRNVITRQHRYEIKLDKYQKPVDMLRKTIYERRYRFRRDNITVDETPYVAILKKLTALRKLSKVIPEQEFFNKLNQLREEYIQISRKGNQE